MSEDDRQIHLQDGRLLGYAEYGDPVGSPLFFFHGLPGSRLDGKLIEGVARQIHVRLIAIDRPGFGLSDFQPGRRITDWPTDVVQLADRLSLDRFSVLGVSGGAPYAAVCASALADRLKAAGIVCGIAPMRHLSGSLRGMSPLARLGLLAARHAPYLLTPLYRTLVGLLRSNPSRFHLVAVSAGPDRAVLKAPTTRKVLSDSFLEAIRNGVEGGVWELGLHGQDWGFVLDGIPMEVHLWHGEQDYTVPPFMGRYLARRIPRCRARFYPADGHFSLPINRAEEILRTLTHDAEKSSCADRLAGQRVGQVN